MATTNKGDGHLVHIDQIAFEDAAGLKKAHESYGASWKKRGGIGAYMVMIRKFDRMEMCAEKYGWDIFKAVEDDPRAEGVLDDIRDARRYLMLIESVLREKGIVKAGDHRDNLPEGGVPRSYSDLDVDAKDLNSHLGLNHVPDAACTCARCLVMERITAEPHIEGCECDNCAEDKSLNLRTDRKRQEPVEVQMVLDPPAHCDCVTCKGIRDAELRDRGEVICSGESCNCLWCKDIREARA